MFFHDSEQRKWYKYHGDLGRKLFIERYAFY